MSMPILFSNLIASKSIQDPSEISLHQGFQFERIKFYESLTKSEHKST